jgi:MFS family permease
VFQYPIGWLSDRMDRRQLIGGVALACGAAALLAALAPLPFVGLAVVALLIGGFANPLYALLLAHTNDFLQAEDMAGASGGLLFINGVGAVAGPLAIGWLMGAVGLAGFFVFIAGLSVLIGVYALWRMTRRVAPTLAAQGSYAPLTPAASVVTLEAAFEAAQPDAAMDTGRQGDAKNSR